MVKNQKISRCVSVVVPPIIGWLSVAVAVFIDGSFVQEFALVAVARVSTNERTTFNLKRDALLALNYNRPLYLFHDSP